MEVYNFHKMFYQYKDRKSQNLFLLKHLEINPVRRQRVKDEHRKYSQSLCSTRFFVRDSKQALVQICQQAFLKILHISRHRLNNIAKRYIQNGDLNEKRGGVANSVKARSAQQIEDIKLFMAQFPSKESHYCRSQTLRRYLSCDLNIEKLYRMYSEWTQLKGVKSSYFRFVFNTQMNFGFGSPASDVCSTCLSFKEQIRKEKGNKLIKINSHVIFFVVCVIHFE